MFCSNNAIDVIFLTAWSGESRILSIKLITQTPTTFTHFMVRNNDVRDIIFPRAKNGYSRILNLNLITQ